MNHFNGGSRQEESFLRDLESSIGTMGTGQGSKVIMQVMFIIAIQQQEISSYAMEKVPIGFWTLNDLVIPITCFSTFCPPTKITRMSHCSSFRSAGVV